MRSERAEHDPDSRYAIRGDEVYDKMTDLTWQRCTLGRHWKDGFCIGVARAMSWDEAMQQGNGVWRLPSKDELLTLVATNCTQPAINEKVFPDVGVSSPWWYWSSTPYEGNASYARVVSFYDGSLSYDRTYALAVRLVRGGQ